jgi:hypothetical protein
MFHLTLTITDLKRWGYISKALRRDPKCDMGNGKDAFGLQAYFDANEISSDKNDWNCIRITHGDVDRNLDDQTYPDPYRGDIPLGNKLKERCYHSCETVFSSYNEPIPSPTSTHRGLPSPAIFI